jgi:hypothetical protein
MSAFHEKTKVELLPTLAAVVLSVAITGMCAIGFAKATGANGSALTSYERTGIITIELLTD